MRTANVTALVQAALSGTYAVQGVPALIEALDSRTADTNHAGWTLAVAYENPSLQLRNLTIWSGSAVDDASDVTVSDLLPTGTVLVDGSVTVDGAPYAGGATRCHTDNCRGAIVYGHV